MKRWPYTPQNSRAGASPSDTVLCHISVTSREGSYFLVGNTVNVLIPVIVFNWNHFEMRLLNLRINFYLLWTFCPHLGRFFFCCCFFFHYVSAKFHLWPSSSDLPRPRIGMLSLVTVSPVITALHSCCLIAARFWPSKPLAGLGRIWNRYLSMLTWNRRDSMPLSAAPRAPKGNQGWILWSYKSNCQKIACTWLVKKVNNRYDDIIWTFLPSLVYILELNDYPDF